MPTNTFLGSQPRKAQVPPNGWLSIIAVFFPAAAQRFATLYPEPVPITITSYFSIIISLISLNILSTTKPPSLEKPNLHLNISHTILIRSLNLLIFFQGDKLFFCAFNFDNPEFSFFSYSNVTNVAQSKIIYQLK